MLGKELGITGEQKDECALPQEPDFNTMIIQINVYLQIAVSSERRISVRMCNKGFWARHGSWNRMP